MKLEDYLQLHATKDSDKVAVISEERAYTYGQLYDMVCEKVKGLPSGERTVVFRATQTIDFLVTYFAIHMAHAVAVPLGKDMPDEVYEKVRKDLKNQILPVDTADILFTTGTTGRAKGVIVSHQAIIANAENLIVAQGYTSELTFIISGPLNHIGSLSKIYPIIVQGATLYLLDGMKDMNAFYSALDSPYQKMATFLVPTSIRMLLRFSFNRLAQYSDKIDFIETGAAPISRSDMTKLCQSLPHSRLYNTYASTETGVISTYNFNDGRCIESCVGYPMKHSSIEIKEGETIVCGGETLMSGYVDDEESISRLSNDRSIATQDVGFIDDEGMLHLQGRNDDIINIGGFKVAPFEVENTALMINGIRDCACIAVNHPISGKALKLLLACNESETIEFTSIAKFLKSKLEGYKVPSLYQYVSHIRRTYNGKIDRKAYTFHDT